MTSTLPPHRTNLLTSVWMPALVLVALMLAYLGQVLVRAGGDPRVFADIGTKYLYGSVRGSDGYDGQFNYFIALNPSPARVASSLDAPAYRYQRILTPLMARGLALGNPALIPWTLAALNLAYQAAAVLILGMMLARRGAPTWPALLFGLWVGLVAGVRLDLPEPLALLLVLLALWSEERLGESATPGSWAARAASWLPGILLAASLLAKETMLPFALGWAAMPIFEKKPQRVAARVLVLAPYLMMQAWLWAIFGQTGLTSGGAGSTSFEVLPMAGLLRVAAASLPVFLIMLIVLTPGVIVPALLSLWAGGRALLKGPVRLTTLILLLNAAMVTVAPFSTFREPLGITRLASGMIVGIILIAAESRRPYIFRWGLLWLSYLALLVE
jgi:hypothetical protein